MDQYVQRLKNVYRTKFYIIKQELSYMVDEDGNSVLHSDDVYYLRNKKADKIFEQTYANRSRINGRRIETNSHTKRYVQ